MEDKKSFLSELADQLNKWDKQLDELTDNALKKKDEIKADLKTEYEKRIADLKVKKEELKVKMDELKKSGDSAWASMKVGLEKAAGELKTSFNEAKTQFKKPDDKPGTPDQK